MNVKKYLVENSEYFMNELERELCIQGISYVRIENEFHFNNQIIRFFDFDDLKILLPVLMKEELKEESLEFYQIVGKQEYERVMPYYESRNKKMNKDNKFFLFDEVDSDKLIEFKKMFPELEDYIYICSSKFFHNKSI